MENKNTTGGGIGFVGALQITFIILKLTKIIKWSWLWVFSPTWISAILIFVCAFIMIRFMRK